MNQPTDHELAHSVLEEQTAQATARAQVYATLALSQSMDRLAHAVERYLDRPHTGSPPPPPPPPPGINPATGEPARGDRGPRRRSR